MSEEVTNPDEIQDDSLEQNEETTSSETPNEVTTESQDEVVADATGVENTEEEEDLEIDMSVVEVIGEEKEEEKVEPVAKKKVEKVNKWYSLRVISGKERKIKERIDLEIMRSGWGNSITSILVPTEKVYKIRNGKKVISERNILPGYILVEADPSNFTGEMITAIANVPNVIHFLGKTQPIPMQQAEANRLLGKVDESQEVGEQMVEPYIVGETVKIIDGPFNEFVGDVLEVSEEKKKLKVSVKIFGRGTEVELSYMQVEKQQ